MYRKMPTSLPEVKRRRVKVNYVQVSFFELHFEAAQVKMVIASNECLQDDKTMCLIIPYVIHK